MTQVREAVLRASGGFLTVYDSATGGHPVVTDAPARGRAAPTGPSALLLHAHTELIPLRVTVRVGSDAELAAADSTAAPDGTNDTDGTVPEAFTTVLDCPMDLPTGQLMLDTSAGAQMSLDAVPAGPVRVVVRTRGGVAAALLEDAHLDADDGELVEQAGPEEWIVDLHT